MHKVGWLGLLKRFSSYPFKPNEYTTNVHQSIIEMFLNRKQNLFLKSRSTYFLV